MNALSIGFVGFGEAASALVDGWRTESGAPPLRLVAYDILFDDPTDQGRKSAFCRAHGVETAVSAASLAAAVDVVVSAVTAEQAVVAAQSVVPGARPELLYLDINSAAPFRKQTAAALLAQRGTRYVDIAVMAPVHPRRHKTPLLISGAAASHIAPTLAALGMSFELVSDRVGDASTIKMVRSIAIKGIESVMTECVLAAHKLGVADRVLPTVASAFTGIDFSERVDYMLERVATHGKRRAEEMREVAATLAHAGLPNFTALATASVQQQMTDLGVKAAFGGNVPQNARRVAETALDLMTRAEAPAAEGKK